MIYPQKESVSGKQLLVEYLGHMVGNWRRSRKLRALFSYLVNKRKLADDYSLSWDNHDDNSLSWDNHVLRRRRAMTSNVGQEADMGEEEIVCKFAPVSQMSFLNQCCIMSIF